MDPDALKAYSSTIEEARADLFGLYYIADEKMLQLGLLQGPVEFLCPLLFLEANLLFSPLPLFFLFPLKYHEDRKTLGDSNMS